MDDFSNHAIRVSVAEICQTVGWTSITSTPLAVLTQLLQQYITDLGKIAGNYALLFGESEPNLNHVFLALKKTGVSLIDLKEYMKHFETDLALSAPKYPIPKQSHLNHVKPGSREIIFRPIHIHDHLPTMDFHFKDKGCSFNNLMYGDEAMSSPALPQASCLDSLNTSRESQESSEKEKEETSIIPLRENNSVVMTSSGLISSGLEGRLPQTHYEAPVEEEPLTLPMAMASETSKLKLKKKKKKKSEKTPTNLDKENKRKEIRKEKHKSSEHSNSNISKEGRKSEHDKSKSKKKSKVSSSHISSKLASNSNMASESNIASDSKNSDISTSIDHKKSSSTIETEVLGNEHSSEENEKRSKGGDTPIDVVNVSPRPIKSVYAKHPETVPVDVERIKSVHAEHPESVLVDFDRIKSVYAERPESMPVDVNRIKSVYTEHSESVPVDVDRIESVYAEHPESVPVDVHRIKSVYTEHPESIPVDVDRIKSVYTECTEPVPVDVNRIKKKKKDKKKRKRDSDHDLSLNYKKQDVRPSPPFIPVSEEYVPSTFPLSPMPLSPLKSVAVAPSRGSDPFLAVAPFNLANPKYSPPPIENHAGLPPPERLPHVPLSFPAPGRNNSFVDPPTLPPFSSHENGFATDEEEQNLLEQIIMLQEEVQMTRVSDSSLGEECGSRTVVPEPEPLPVLTEFPDNVVHSKEIRKEKRDKKDRQKRKEKKLKMKMEAASSQIEMPVEVKKEFSNTNENTPVEWTPTQNDEKSDNKKIVLKLKIKKEKNVEEYGWNRDGEAQSSTFNEDAVDSLRYQPSLIKESTPDKKIRSRKREREKHRKKKRSLDKYSSGVQFQPVLPPLNSHTSPQASPASSNTYHSSPHINPASPPHHSHTSTSIHPASPRAHTGSPRIKRPSRHDSHSSRKMKVATLQDSPLSPRFHPTSLQFDSPSPHVSQTPTSIHPASPHAHTGSPRIKRVSRHGKHSSQKMKYATLQDNPLSPHFDSTSPHGNQDLYAPPHASHALPHVSHASPNISHAFSYTSHTPLQVNHASPQVNCATPHVNQASSLLNQTPMPVSSQPQPPIWEPDPDKIWICPTCNMPDDGTPMIACDRCDDWFHWRCVGITHMIEQDWYCSPCIRIREELRRKKHKKKKLSKNMYLKKP